MRILAFLLPAAVAARSFLAWWRAELLGMLPPILRKLLNPGSRCLALHVGAGNAVFCRWEGGKGRQVAEVDLADERKLEATLTRHRRRNTKLVLCIGRERVLFKEITLPALPDAELRRALYYQIDRETPFAAADVVFDHVVVTASQGRLRTLLAVVPKRVVEQESRRLQELGVHPDGVAIADPGDGAPPLMSLRSGFSEEAPVRSFADVVNAAAAATACGLIFATGSLAIGDRQAIASTLTAQVQGARRAADETATLEREIGLLRKDLTFFADRKRRHPTAAAILLELTHILPDHTWLTEMQYRAGEVRLAGHSATAADLIAIIDGSEMFQDPRFRSPVTPDTASGKERFNLTFQVTAGEGGGR